MAEYREHIHQKIRLYLVSPTKYDWSDVAKSIAGGNTYDKAKAIYAWLIDNIKYDVSHSIYDSDMAWKKKKGVCQAYCELYYRIGLAAGLDVRIITGFGRTKADFDEIQENHCWIVVNKCTDTSQTYSFPETITYEEGEEEKCNK